MRVTIISGANSGFGMLTALAMAKLGYQVIAGVRNIDKGQRLIDAARLSGIDKSIEVVKLDITKSVDISSLFQYISDRYGKLDVLINNAGYAQGGFIDELTMDLWREQFNTNLFGHIEMTQKFLPLIRQNGGGRIINVSSISGYFGFPGLAPYTSSKHALEGWSESLRLELVPESIWVSLVEPASYRTAIWEKSLQKITDQENRPLFQQNLLNQAKKNGEISGDPQKVADLIVRICETKKPKLRYPIGPGTKPLLKIKNLLPWSLVEKLVQNKLRK